MFALKYQTIVVYGTSIFDILVAFSLLELLSRLVMK